MRKDPENGTRAEDGQRRDRLAHENNKIQERSESEGPRGRRCPVGREEGGRRAVGFAEGRVGEAGDPRPTPRVGLTFLPSLAKSSFLNWSMFCTTLISGILTTFGWLARLVGVDQALLSVSSWMVDDGA